MAKHDPETENPIAELIRAAEAGCADAQTDLAWKLGGRQRKDD